MRGAGALRGRVGHLRRRWLAGGDSDNIAPVGGLRKRCSSALVAVALVAIGAAPGRAAAAPGARPGLGAGVWSTAGAWPASLVTAEPRDAAPAAVVGLDADAPEQGAALTKALRKAFAARGLSGGEEVNLTELRLALGCKDDSPKCLARGGPLVGARRLIYGTLHRGKGKVWKLEVTLVEVDGGAASKASLSLADAELAADRVDAIAEEVADRLAPDTAVGAAPEQGEGGLAAPVEPVEPSEPSEPSEATYDADATGRKGKLRWGWVEPQPRWQLAGFGVGVTLTVVGFATTAASGVWLTSKNGGFRKELVDAAEASLSDENELNDVDPNLPEGINLCDFARERPTMPDGSPLGMPGQVRNKQVVEVCNKGDVIRTVEVSSAVVGAVGLATTVVFTLLLTVHRDPVGRPNRSTTSTWKRHRLQVGVDPVRGQGLSLRVGGRF